MGWGGQRARRSTGVRRCAGVLLAVLATLGTGVMVAGPAAAHAELVGSTPSDGQNLSHAPAQLLLRLSESVELDATRVTLTDGTGHEVAPTYVRLRKKPDADTEEPTALVVGLPPLGTGHYRVSWTTLSSDDLHVTQGVLVFGVGQQVRAAGLPAEPRPGTPESAVRWVGLLGLGVTLGAALLLTLLGRGRRPLESVVRRRVLTTALAGVSVAAVAGGLLPLAQAARADGAVLSTVRRLLLHESFGAWWWTHEVALVGILLVVAHSRASSPYTRLSRTTVAAATALAGAAVTSTVLMGHAGARPGQHVGTVVIESVHVASALTWAGAVVAAAVALTANVAAAPGVPGLRAHVLGRFGIVAAACVSTAAVTGLLLAGRRIATPDALLHSVYGKALLVKLVVAGAALLLGAVNTVLLRPELLPRALRPRDGRTLTRHTVVVEAIVVVGLLAATAALAAAPPANGQRWRPVARTGEPVSAQAADLVETLEVKPNRVGDNFLALRAFDTRRPSPGAPTAVTMQLRGPEGRRIDEVATHAADGSWVVAGAPLAAGQWTARTVVTRDGLPDAVARYRWAVPDPLGRQVTGWRARPLRDVTDTFALGLLVVVVVVATASVGLRRHQAALPVARQSRAPVERDLSGRGTPS